MPFFLGREPPPAPLTTTAQKCFRTPDIDEVGLDTYHLTFFEMLGNFSFGQYFKEGAIEYATEFIRERLKLDWDRIWVSVHAGDPELKLGPDEVAIDLWEKIGMPPERIVPLPSSENFWSVGGPGPCGPDSEIYYDWGAEAGCGEPDCLPGLHALRALPRVLEPRLHGVRAPPGRDADAAAEAEHRHRPGPRAHGADRPGRRRRVYDTDGYQQIMALDRRAVRRRVRRLGRRDEGAPRARRPRARDDVPRRRRRHAVERGARLRPAPRHPPRGRSTACGSGCRRRSSPGLAGDGDRADGRRVPGARRAPRPDRADPRAPRRSASPRRSSAG